MVSKDKKLPGEDLIAGAARADVPIRSMDEEEMLRLRPLGEEQRERELIWRLIQTRNRESLLKAFATNSWTAWDLIATVAASDDPALAALVPELATTLASLLEDQTLKERTVVRLHLREALASTTRDPRERSEAIAVVLREAATLPENTRADVLRSVVSSFKPLEVMPNLIRFLPVARRHGPGVLQDFLGSIDSLIEHGFAVYDDKPALARDCRDTTLSLIAELLLKDDTHDESLVEQVAGIVRARATTLGEGLHPVIEKLAKASNVAVKLMAWPICGKVLSSPDQAELGLIDAPAAKWVIEHLSGEEEHPWTWRVYVHILRCSKDKDQRIAAAGRLGAYGPTSMQDPLPDDVKEVLDLLDDVFNRSEYPELRKAAKAALDLNRAGGVKAAGETRTIICDHDWESSAALSSACIVDLGEPPKLLILTDLLIAPSPAQTSSVVRINASQEVSRGSAAAPSPDLDLAAAEFGGSAALAQGVQDVTQYATDPARIAGLKALITFLSSNIEPVVEMFRQPLLRYSREWPDFIPALVRILDRLRAKLVAMNPVSINEQPPAPGADGGTHGQGLSAGTAGQVGNGVTEESAPVAANQGEGGAATIEEAIKRMLSTYYTPIKAGELLKLSDRTIREHCESRTIRAIQVGRDWYISPQAVEDFARNPPRRGPKPKRGSSL